MLRTTERLQEKPAMMTIRSLTLPLFALVAVLAGCSAEAGTSAGPETASSTESTLVADQGAAPSAMKPNFRGHRGHFGPERPDFLVHAALRAPINLTAEQRATIEGLVKKLEAPKPEADGAGPAKLAAAIRSNSFDSLPRPTFDKAKFEAHAAESAKALTTLHDTLTAEQRTALVDSLAQHGEHGPRGDFQGKTASTGEGREGRQHGPRGEGMVGHFEGGPMMHMLGDLNLTQEQKDAIEAKFEAEHPAKPSDADREQMKARFEAIRTEMKAKLETFKSDKFDATAFVTPNAKFAPPSADKAPHTNPMAIISSVLTAEQREQLATKIEQGPKFRANADVKVQAKEVK
ncbi:hypothetical protein AKJ09_06567 [Labilithrix luteola]|uniref:Lipoprotein n=1 Tax=Labilithrix luteola TaxID=1391654 RepID=A0A0K1Q2A8_9BACT|nr:hypothetical protein [Labilithrix luteola]AKU99903.1 hypothetical protein AKJ09_06567 [Labilithrix luteola]